MRIILLSFSQLSLIFFLVVFFVQIGVLQRPAGLINLAYVLPLLALTVIAVKKSDHSEPFKISNWLTHLLVLGAIGFAIGSRFIPPFKDGMPLGYDPGYYKYAFDVYLNALPNIPESSLAQWFKELHEQGLFVLGDVVHVVTGLGSTEMLQFLFIFMSILPVLMVYMLGRHLAGNLGGLIATWFAVVSLTQFTGFAYYYFRQGIGVTLLLLAILALERRKWGLLTLCYAAIAAYHRPEFLLLSLVIVLACLLGWLRRSLVWSTVAAGLLLLPFWLPRSDVIVDLVRGTISVATRQVQGAQFVPGGTFFGLNGYEQAALAYIPLGIAGVLIFLLKKQWNAPFILFIVLLSLVTFRLVFYNRLIFHLDILLGLFAAVFIVWFLERIQKHAWRLFCLGVTGLVLITAAIPTIREANKIEPLFTPVQVAAAEWIADNSHKDSFTLATSLDAPLALGWSERKVIAPGLFEWNQHNRSEWATFLSTSDPNVGREFLSHYGDTIYILYTFSSHYPLNLDKFGGPSFSTVYEGANVIVIRYNDEDKVP